MCSSKIKIRKSSSPRSTSDLIIQNQNQNQNHLCMKKKKNKKTTHHSSRKPAAVVPLKKTTKTRKHKFLSLGRELIISKPNNSTNLDSSSRTSSEMIIIKENNLHDDENQHQLNLFPLHPERENLIETSERISSSSSSDLHDFDNNNNNMAYCFFDSSDQSGATLNGLLWGSGGGGGGVQCSSEEDSLSPPLTYAYQGKDSDQGVGDHHDQTNNSLLVRNALRHKERDDSTTEEEEEEEKWVSYSEVLVEKMITKEEEMSSSTCTPLAGPNHDDYNQQRGYHHHFNQNQIQQQRLSLKLDYQEIMNAWSDKGSLYIGDCSSSSSSLLSHHQIVPDILYDDPLLPQDHTNVLGADAGSMLWRVPDHHDGSSGILEAVDGQESEGMKMMMMMEEREARVLRYKEKRQSRLFSKRIRYEVRKLNAEKRPRMKGRFVKRN